LGSFLKAVVGISLLGFAAFYGARYLSGGMGGYTPSDQVLNAAEISKNPYRFKGMSGVMNANRLRFSNMAGDQTAIYDNVLSYSSDQLAVHVDNNEPPSTGRWWRIYVDGTMNGTNGFGAPITIGEVRFEGYADPSPQPVAIPVLPPPAQPAATPEEQTPAPIERQPPQ
jgi:hypothetical protein